MKTEREEIVNFNRPNQENIRMTPKKVSVELILEFYEGKEVEITWLYQKIKTLNKTDTRLTTASCWHTFQNTQYFEQSDAIAAPAVNPHRGDDEDSEMIGSKKRDTLHTYRYIIQYLFKGRW
tara:strand:+ start:153 stop:518 length:366 start_codon:yes stop_codon:yes gene_type:complete